MKKATTISPLKELAKQASKIKINKKLNTVANHAGLGADQNVGHFGVDLAAPRPAADVLDAFVVNRDHGDLVVRRLA